LKRAAAEGKGNDKHAGEKSEARVWREGNDRKGKRPYEGAKGKNLNRGKREGPGVIKADCHYG